MTHATLPSTTVTASPAHLAELGGGHSCEFTRDLASNAASRPRWGRLHLTDEESQNLAEAARQSTCDPAADPAGFRAEAQLGWAALNSATLDRLAKFARGESGRPELYITNLPLDTTLPPTPVNGQFTDSVTSTMGEYLQVTFSLALGLPISYLDQRAGRLVHDVFPTRFNAEQVSSQSSAVTLGFHTEMFFHPQPPEFLILHCLRPDPEHRAATSIASLDDIKSRLTEQQISVLSEPRFALDLARLHGTYRFDGRTIDETDPRPVIAIVDEKSAGGVEFRFEPGLTTAIDEHAHDALIAADRAAEEVRAEGHLCEGGMLLLDNRRAVHSRSPFKANFDGRDRWLRRMMIGTTNDAGAEVMAQGFHRRPNLEVARAWETSGVALRVVPYGVGGYEDQRDTGQISVGSPERANDTVQSGVTR